MRQIVNVSQLLTDIFPAVAARQHRARHARSVASYFAVVVGWYAGQLTQSEVLEVLSVL